MKPLTLERTQSSLLIPEKFLDVFFEKTEEISREEYFHRLLSNADWIEFGLLANWLGISRTALFTLFLILDLAGWDKFLREKFFDNGVPPNITALGWGATLQGGKQFARIGIYGIKCDFGKVQTRQSLSPVS